MGRAQPSTRVPAVGDPIFNRVFPTDCETVHNAATAFLQTRGVQILVWPFKGKNWRSCLDIQCYSLRFDGFLDSAGNHPGWNQIKRQYTIVGSQSQPHENQRAWSRGNGYWERATSKWHVGGSMWFRRQWDGCFMKVDLFYGRGIYQYLEIFPWEGYDQSVSSNGLLEQEILEGTAQKLGRKTK